MDKLETIKARLDTDFARYLASGLAKANQAGNERFAAMFRERLVQFITEGD